MKRFELTDVQAEAILNMRLRALRKLEEIELRKEHRGLTKERRDIQVLLKDERLRWDAHRRGAGSDAHEVRRRYTRQAAHRDRRGTACRRRHDRGLRRTRAADGRAVRQGLDPRVQGAPRGRCRAALQGRRREKLRLPCQTTDQLTLFGTNGRAYTLKPADLPRGRGDGQPVRLLADLTNEDDVVALFIPNESGKYLVASTRDADLSFRVRSCQPRNAPASRS